MYTNINITFIINNLILKTKMLCIFTNKNLINIMLDIHTWIIFIILMLPWIYIFMIYVKKYHFKAFKFKALVFYYKVADILSLFHIKNKKISKKIKKKIRSRVSLIKETKQLKKTKYQVITWKWKRKNKAILHFSAKMRPILKKFILLLEILKSNLKNQYAIYTTYFISLLLIIYILFKMKMIIALFIPFFLNKFKSIFLSNGDVIPGKKLRLKEISNSSNIIQEIEDFYETEINILLYIKPTLGECLVEKESHEFTINKKKEFTIKDLNEEENSEEIDDLVYPDNFVDPEDVEDPDRLVDPDDPEDKSNQKTALTSEKEDIIYKNTQEFFLKIINILKKRTKNKKINDSKMLEEDSDIEDSDILLEEEMDENAVLENFNPINYKLLTQEKWNAMCDEMDLKWSHEWRKNPTSGEWVYVKKNNPYLAYRFDLKTLEWEICINPDPWDTNLTNLEYFKKYVLTNKYFTGSIKVLAFLFVTISQIRFY